MVNTVKVKTSTTPAKVPTVSDIGAGEFGINITDGKLYFSTGASIIEVHNSTAVIKSFEAAGIGIPVITAAGVVTSRSIQGTTNQITVADGNGVAGNPTISIADNPVFPGTAGVSISKGTSAQRSGTPSDGDFRYNTNLLAFEGRINGTWANFLTVSQVNNFPVSFSQRTTTYTLTATLTNITFNSILYENETTTVARDGTNTDRVYVYEDGLYLLACNGTVLDGSNGNLTTVRFALNGSTAISGTTQQVESNNDRTDFSIIAPVFLTAGQYVTLQASRGAGGGTGTIQTDLYVYVMRMKGPKGDKGDPGQIGGNNNYIFQAGSFDNPTTSDWVVNSLAPAAADGTNSALTIRAFDDTVAEGIGFTFTVPPASTTVSIEFKIRPATSQTGTKVGLFKLYRREFVSGGTAGSWNAGVELDTIDFTTNVTQYVTQNYTLTELGLTAGVLTNFELIRDATNVIDTVVGDLNLIEFTMKFS